MEDLKKVLEAWRYISTHTEGKLSKRMEELIIQTIRLLEELKESR